MPGDYSRKTFNRKKHYRGVLMQQGRVQVDADWNEQLYIQQYRTFTEAKDVIGKAGVPKEDNGFKISISIDGSDLNIAPGRIYVEGMLCELDDKPIKVTYFKQPYYLNPDSSFFITSPPGSPLNSPPLSPIQDNGLVNMYNGVYIVYIDTWQREVNFVDDPLIHEVALGEADTTTRLQNVWQVKLVRVAVADADQVNCSTSFEEWQTLSSPSSGMINVRTNRTEEDLNPCLLPPTAGYRRLENQLYRVEIQSVNATGGITFKWSRDNATVESKIEEINGTYLTVSSVGKDEILGFSTGQWVELIDEESSLNGTPNLLMQITSLDPDTRKIGFSSSVESYKLKTNLKLRRWDQQGSTADLNGVPAIAGWINLEDGIQVKFSPGTFKPGDYWLIPARTATGEVEWPPYAIPNLYPVEQRPLGIKHAYSKLALLKVNDGSAVLEDCRSLFPSLTDICAEDICFDNKNCNFGKADNVQEALDLLCAANDLRLHNKLLHGDGVVCGLKITCGQNRQQVNISSGYALDCEGNIIQLKKDIPYDVVSYAAANELLDTKGWGTVSLFLSGKGSSGELISIEKYVQKSFWEEILENSLIKDFYDDHIQNIVLFLKDQLSFSLVETVPVPVKQRRLTAVINLFAQLINSASGPYAFISGEKGKRDPQKDCGGKSDEEVYEDQLIWCFYNDLKKLLSSETYCAMFDLDRPFPDYKIDPGLNTIFGTPLKFHTKLKLDPKGTFAFTCGFGNKIHVYNLQTNELVQVLIFPSASNIQVMDIAISPDGKELYTVGVVDNKDSYFAVAAIDSSGTLTWGSTSPKCGKKYVTLAINPRDNKLYAISFDEGLFVLENIGSSSFSAVEVRAGFHPTGLLKFSDDGSIAITASSTSGGTTFSKINLFNISIPGNFSNDTFFLFNGEDVANDLLFFNNKVYVTGNSAASGSQKVLGGFDLITGGTLTPVTLESSSAYRVALVPIENTFYILVTLADKCKVIRVALNNLGTGGNMQVDVKFRIPVQLFPMAIVINNFNKNGYVLNMLVNTLTAIDLLETFSKSNPPNFTLEPPYELSDYRDNVLNAFKDVFSHLLQYLKDGFCEEFLIDCPTCSEADKVYLGSVEIRDRKVYHICNFSKRKYVKSFPTVEYWLSTVPVLPIFKQAFTKFCCKVF